MSKPYETVVAEYANYPKAEIGLKVLEMRGFGSDRVSLITKNDSELVELEKARRERLERPGPGVSGGAGAALAAGAAMPLAVGTTLAPFFLIGPIVAAAAGAAAGTLFGDDKKWTLDEATADNYQERVREGSILLVVHASGDDLTEAFSGLKTTDALSLERF